MKKNSNLQELMGYAGGHRYLTYLSLLLSAISAILALFPFVFLFRIIQEVIAVAQLRPGHAHRPQRLDGGGLCSVVHRDLCLCPDVFPFVSLPHCREYP